MRTRCVSTPIHARTLVASAIAACIAGASVAGAAENGVGAEEAGDQLAEVIVTGSRLPASSTFVSPTPTTTLTAEQLQISAPESLAAGLRTLPSIVPGGGPTAGGGTAAGGQNFINMRGLGNDRTLVLVDGRRYVPSGPNIQIDTNLIPQALVQRVDVVTGGASAAYGSDAVGGVVNFILNKQFSGLKGNLGFGMSDEGDNDEKKASLAFGTGFAGGRGHVIGSVEYFDAEGLEGSARGFRRTAPNMIRNPSGAPTWVRISDLRTPFTPGSLIITGAGGSAANNLLFQGRQFTGRTEPVPYNWGTLATRTATGSQNGGDGLRVSTGQEIVRPLHRETAFLHGTFDFNDSVRAFVQAVHGDTESAFQSSPITRTFTIRRDNAFLVQTAPVLVAEMTSRGVTSLSVNRLVRETGVSLNVNKNESTNFAAGLEGDIGKWKWELSVERGENRNHNFMDPNLILNNFTLALDAVVNPANQQIVCRSTITNPTNGCVPFNPFGEGSPSATALAYVTGVSDFTTRTRQSFADAQIAGTLFNLPAGEVSAVVGAEFRKISAVTLSDPLSNAGAFRLVNQQDFRGDYNIKEVFAETNIPLLSDLPAVQQLDLNLAGRRTDYSTSGGVTTWKAGVNWQVIDQLRLRGTYSRDIRAPNLLELFATGRQNNITVADTLTNQTYFSVPNRTFGNAALQPERARTLVFGFVAEPSNIEGLRLAVDYWNIRINSAIANIGGQDAVTQCNLSNQTSAICAFVTRDPTTRAVTATQAAPFNLTVQKTHGMDFETSYRTGPWSIRALAGTVRENISQSPLVLNPLDDAGTNTASQPKWRASLSTGFEQGAWDASLQGRYLSSTVWDRTRNVLGVDTDFNRIGSMFYLDGQVSYSTKSWGGKQSWYLNIQNILDRAPPFAPNTGGATPLPTNPNLYDQVGRMWRVGVRVEF
jgi:iron complex outermembrane recepter protein